MTAPLSLIAYRTVSFLATPLAGPILAMRLRRGKEDPRRIGERRGLTRLARPPGPLVWLHGASVGEAAVLLPFVERITRTGATALVTTGTLTSAALLAQRLPPGALHQYAPLDSPLFVRRFLRHWRPDAALVAESELWPNMIVELKRSGSPLAMVNGRISERSLSRWMKAPRFIAALMKDFDLCLARSESDGERLVALGAPRVLVAGDVKFDAPTLPADRRELAELAGLTSGRQIWIAASTHEGEEMIAAAAHRRLRQVFPDALTLIAPRHPDRGEAVLRQLEAQGLVCALRSRGDAIGPGTAVYVCDTIGELGLFYRLAGVVFVGKSFVGGGGQNPIEPARLACAILHGPMVANFADAYAALDDAGGALAVARPEDLGDALIALFVNAARLRAMARAAGDTVERRAGAVDRSMRALKALLPVAEAAR
jgi:3-deoxy-D-manno-octulosonic-acid transferase